MKRASTTISAPLERGGKRAGRGLTLGQRKTVLGYAFLLPYLTFFLVFLLLPVLASVALAFTEWELLRGTFRFAGLNNFVELLQDDLFWVSLKNSFYFATMTTAGVVLLALGTALAVKSLVVGQQLFRLIFYAPVILSVTVIGIIFQRIFANNGLLNYGLSFANLGPFSFLGDPNLVMPFLSVTTIWWTFGFPMLIFIAALYSVPSMLYEAARLDGANAWQLFWRLTLPLIRPAFLFVLVTQFMSHFQVFGQPFVMTEGGPGYASYTSILHIYRTAWRYYHMGQAASMSLIVAVVMLGFSLVQFRLFGQRVEY
jgi:multiple sugar transport system permease protein